MAEKKKDERTTARTEVEKALVKALSDDMGEIPEVSITVEELKQLAAADKKKRKKRAAKYASVAAVAVIVCAAVVFMAWPETVVPVDADKNTEQRVETGDGEIVINEGEIQGDSGIVEIDEFDWKHIKDHRKDAPKLGLPQYIPDGYDFKSLHIEIYKEDGFNAEYKFNKGDEELFIKQREYNRNDVKTVLLEGEVEEITTKQGKVYILKDNQEATTIIKQIGTSDLTIIGNLDTDDLIKIVNKIAMP